MSYKFYFGNSGSGKSYRMKMDIINESMLHPERKYLFIVPDQYTMQEQVDFVKMHKNHGIMNIDVLSFGRLTHRVFEEVGHEDKIVLDDTGKNLILRQVSFGIKDELPSIGSSLNKPGFIHQIKSVISEFMQYSISPQDVDRLIEKTKARQALCYKLKDIQKLYEGFFDYKENHLITSEETLTLLAEAVPSSELIKDSIVIFDGFTGFTPLQYQVITKLMHYCSEVWFGICIDKAGIESDNNDSQLFALSKKTIWHIRRIAKEENIKALPDIYLDTPGIRFESSEIKHLEENLFRKKYIPYAETCNDLHIMACSNPREELRRICIKICELIQEKKMAYRDFAIVTGSLERYAPYASEIFEAYGIPVFVDQNRKLTLNPFIEYVKSGLNVIESDFSYQSVMHMLRSGMTDLSEDEIDKFDNYLLALKIKGVKRYAKDFVRIPSYLRVMKEGKKSVTDDTVSHMADINATREKFMAVLAPILDLRTGEHKASNIVSALYEYIKLDNVFDKLCKYSEYFQSQNDFVRKKEYDQVYMAFMKLLETIDSIMGQEIVSLQEFIAILEAGISEIKIGVLPGEIDYVLLGDIERSRIGSVKTLFFAGVNDGVIPKNNGNGGLISDLDREYLIAREEELAPSPRQQMFNQRLYLYMNMTKPSNSLYLSYSKTDEDGKAIRPAYLIDIVKRIFVNLDEEDCTKDEISIENIWGQKTAISFYSNMLRLYAANRLDEKEKNLLTELYKYIKGIPEESEKAREYLEAAFYTYTTEPLTKEIIRGLYGLVLENSVSKLERYAACAYSHFLRYGLELEEREQFDTSSMDTGNIYHMVLQTFSDMMRQLKLKWEDLDDNELSEYLDQAFEQVVPEYKESIFYQDSRNMYQLEKMKRILFRTVKTLGFQIKKTSFVPRRFEMGFSHVLDAGNIRLGLSEDEKMLISGRIDRVDTYEENDSIYVKVVDYKSSDRKINLIEFYNGLSLQLVIYLDQAVKKMKKENPDKNVHPSAMYYYAVTDPLIDSEDGLTEEELEKKIHDKLKLAGYTVNDDNLIPKVGGEFEKASEVINVTKKKDGTYTANSDLIDEGNLEIMMDYGQYMLENLGKSILEGNIKAYPCGEKACNYCNYKDVCSFDTNIEGYEKREYMELDEKNVFAKMSETLKADKYIKED